MTLSGLGLMVALIAGTATAQPTGAVVGCIVDPRTVSGTPEPLPGVTVITKVEGVKRTTTTDRDGCYELRLPPGAYRLTLRLPGYNNINRDQVLVTSSANTSFDATMRRTPKCECVRLVGDDLPSRLRYADAVLHVRLADFGQASTLEGYYRHRATVIDIVKPADAQSAPTFIVQDQRSGVAEPYDVGQEILALVKASSVYKDSGWIISGEPDWYLWRDGTPPAMVFLVQDGRIQSTPSEFPEYVGHAVKDVLEEWRTILRKP